MFLKANELSLVQLHKQLCRRNSSICSGTRLLTIILNVMALTATMSHIGLLLKPINVITGLIMCPVTSVK